MHERGVTPVLGIVLLVGITVAGSMALFIVGTSFIGDSQERAQSAQVERSMVTLAGTTDDLHAGERTNATYSFAGTGDEHPTVRPEAGRLNITHYVGGTAETVVVDDRSLGAMYYERGGTEYAYQAGGVWERTDSGDTRLIRNPSVRYGNGMLSFSFINVTGERGISANSGTVSATEATDRFPTKSLTNPLENGTVLVELESRYCGGWETHFRQQTDGSIAESCSETGDTVDGELQVELVVPFEFDGMENSYNVIANSISEPSNPHAGIHGAKKIGHDYPSASTLVEQKVDSCASGDGSPVTGSTISGAGLHCASSLDKTSSYTFDTTGGDITLAVDGPVNPGGLEIQGNGEVTILANGSVFDSVAGSFEIGEPGAAEQLQILVHSDHDVGASGWGSTDVYAFLYAPESKVTMDGGGTPDFEGAMIVDDLQMGGTSDIYYDSDVTGVDFGFDSGGQALYYLHVDETQVRFSDGAASTDGWPGS